MSLEIGGTWGRMSNAEERNMSMMCKTNIIHLNQYSAW